MGALATEALLSDRFSEFQQLASRKASPRTHAGSDTGRSSRTAPAWLLIARGQSPARDDAAKDPSGSKQGAGFMREFFQDCGDIQKMLSTGRDGVRDLNTTLSQVVCATTREAQKSASDNFARTSEETTACVTDIKKALEALKSKAEAEEQKQASAKQPSERRIRANMQQALGRKHQQLLLDFQKAQLDYKSLLQRQEEREMRLVCPEANDEELQLRMEAGENRTQMVARKVAGAHGLIVDEIQRIQEKHQDILRLEQSCQELAQMFQEVAVLVDAQGELLDNIEAHVHSAKGKTSQAVEELQVARKVQRSNRKWTCYAMLCLAIIALAILLPVLLKLL